MGARRYFTKPVEVAAIQWDGTQEVAEEIIEWFVSANPMRDVNEPSPMGEFVRVYGVSPEVDTRNRITLKSHNTTLSVFVNEWILRTESGAFEVRDHDSFRDIYTLGEN